MDPSMIGEVEHAITERTGMLTHEKFMRLWLNLGGILTPFLKLAGKDAKWFADGMRWRYIKWLCPDYACGWILPAVLGGLKLTRQHRPSIIYATGPPWSDLVIGLILSKLTGIALVADFRDLWIDNFNPRPVAGWREWIDPKLERSVVSCAARTICTTESSTAAIAEKYPRIPRTRFTTIFNGYDANDFPNGRDVTRADARMTISHVGSLYGKQTPLYFLHALESLLREKPSLRGQLRVRFIGHAEEFEGELRGSPCSDVIEMAGSVSHEQAVEDMVAADVLLLILGEGGEPVVPGKTFEYMASNTPILATVPLCGEVASMLQEAGGAKVVDFNDVAGMKEAVAQLHAEWLNGGLQVGCSREFARQFERRRLAARMAEVFDECITTGRGRNKTHRCGHHALV